MQLAFDKFLSIIKEKFKYSVSIVDTALPQKFSFILDRNLAKANSTENHLCMSCDKVASPWSYDIPTLEDKGLSQYWKHLSSLQSSPS